MILNDIDINKFLLFYKIIHIKIAPFYLSLTHKNIISAIITVWITSANIKYTNFSPAK